MRETRAGRRRVAPPGADGHRSYSSVRGCVVSVGRRSPPPGRPLLGAGGLVRAPFHTPYPGRRRVDAFVFSECWASPRRQEEASLKYCTSGVRIFD
ncbi:hypothetical protein NDU88_005837 [Pleurodeles waltl]|uniref:Uncharacterized protein n=1 Tax=Pleurodeles waltl TaxID=8319 RepID=A0AAV7NRP7_PLEWA|nr:hypothetical protein NDU88_005837 [Pleurodeles waltl]